jgi:hypothetical protein
MEHTLVDGRWRWQPTSSGGGSYDIATDRLDEDNMSTNSATKVPSQQSVKAYVDTADATKADLAGDTFTGSVTFEDAINENVFAITDGASVTIDPDNGTVQTWTLTGDHDTFSDGLTAGQSVLLMITAGSNTIDTWPTMKWIGGSAPTLATGTDITCIELWKDSSNLYGAHVGNAS